MKILIVEDEKAISDIIAFNLKRSGYEVLQALTGTEGLAMAKNHPCDLILLDIMLPEMDGFQVLSQVRNFSEVPVIMVTAREEELDKVLALESGADDYVTKPFSVNELMARVKANTRRQIAADKGLQGHRAPAFGAVFIDHENQMAYKDEKPFELTQREYELLVYFVSNANRVIPREELMEKVWGYEYYGDLRAVDVAMRRLREKIEDDPSNPTYILTKRGLGYFLSK